jgi:transposase
MSLSLHELDPIPEATRRLIAKACPKGTPATRLRDALGPIYHDEDFADLFPKRGRPAEAPWRLALVTVLQVMENLTDRQAAAAVCLRLDWKYALSLSPEDEGFDYSILCDFRERLISQHAEERLLEPILQVCRAKGWLKAGGKQRTDSTHILAAVRTLSSIESVGETLRASLNELAEVDPDWLVSVISEDWFDRYVHRVELARLPKAGSQREAWVKQLGQDVLHLLEAAQRQGTPALVRQASCWALLQQVWQQHYEVVNQQVRWRDGPAVSSQERVVSPYDPEARCSRKRELSWLGFKVHFTETCDEDEHIPHVITQVTTTLSTTSDEGMLSPILDDLCERDLAPAEHLVDMGYTSGEELAKQADLGTQILGPVGPTPGWQAQQHGGFAPADFELDWEHEQAICPQGEHSLTWKQAQDGNRPIIKIQFATATCRQCPVREQCTHSSRGRSLTVLPKAAQEAREERLREQGSKEFQQRYARRAGVEATISAAVRTKGLRRCPSRGLVKAHLHHVSIASAINLVRLDTGLLQLAQGKPVRPVRPLSPFARLKERACA